MTDSNVRRLELPRRRQPLSDLPAPSQFVLVVEEDSRAMEFFGPFPSEETAMSFAEVTQPDVETRSWWVTELIVPHLVEGISREELAARGWRDCGPNGVNGKVKEFPRSSKTVTPTKTARPLRKAAVSHGPISAQKARIQAARAKSGKVRIAKKKSAKKSKRGNVSSSKSDSR